MVRFPLVLAAVLISASSWATTYYISTSGSDSNNGTSKSSPWQHAKGMTGCTANCNAYVPADGDRLIFRGGDSWHYNSSRGVVGLPWSMMDVTGPWRFSASNPGYVGVDHTWWDSSVCGSSWCRPVLDGDNPLSVSAVSSCTYPQASLVSLGIFYGTFEGFEMKGYCWNDSNPAFMQDEYIGIAGANLTIRDVYIHGWTHTTSASSQAGAFAGGTDGVVLHFDSVVVDGQDSDPKSLFSIAFNNYDVQNSVFRYNSNQVGNGAHIIANNLYEYIYEPYDSAHGNVMEWNNEASGSNYIFNNVVRHVSTAVTLWVCPNSQDYYFNNVLFDIGSQGWDFADSSAGGPCSGASGTGNWYNNTWQSAGASVGKSGSWNGKFNNNFWISAGGIGGTPLSVANSISTTDATATTYGYTAANSYAPTSTDCNGNQSASGCPVGKGANLTTACNGIPDTTVRAACLMDSTLGPSYDAVNHRVVGTFRTPVSRPATGAWDVGAVQGSSGGGVTAPSGLVAVAH